MPQITKEIPLDPVAKKTVLRLFTYGLYAVGVAAGEDRNMFTANWVTQVSFEPPLIAMSVQNDGHSIELIRQSRSFAISVLGEDQKDIAGLLGKRWKLRPEKIGEVAYRLGMTGSPILEDALGSVECIVTDSVAAGDSTLVVGRVMSAAVGREGTPLTMAAAGFRHAG